MLVENRKIEMASLRLLVYVAFLIFNLTACLETRNSMKAQEEKQELKQQMVSLQRSSADVNVRFQDIEDDLRKSKGRFEVVENKILQSNVKFDQSLAALDANAKERDTAYREEFLKLQTEVQQLRNELNTIQEERRKEAQARIAESRAQAAEAKKNPYQVAAEKFEKKNYKEAILDFEKYRRKYPKGQHFAIATYQMGVAFSELGMTDDAKAFFDEVIAKFPNSAEAKKAKAKLKTLK